MPVLCSEEAAEQSGNLSFEESIPQTFLELFKAQNSPLDPLEMATRILKRVGGQEGFADLILEGFKNTKAGSLAHVRYTVLITEIFKSGRPRERKEDKGHLSEADLERLFVKEMRKYDKIKEREEAGRYVG